MPSNVRKELIRIITAAAVVFACFLAADGLDARAQESNHPGSATGVAWQLPASRIELTDVYSFWTTDSGFGAAQTGIYYDDCVAFTNTADIPATHVQVMFASVDARGDTSDAALPLDIGVLAKPNVLQNSNVCRDHAYAQGAKGRWLVGWVNEVTYQDGTTWHAQPVVAGKAVPTTSAVLLSNVVTRLPVEECASISNGAKKTIVRVRVQFSHLDADGTSIGSDPFDIRAKLKPGEMLSTACRPFPGTAIPDIVAYARASYAGQTLGQPIIDYLGRRSSLVAAVVEVEFDDGSFWKSASGAT